MELQENRPKLVKTELSEAYPSVDVAFQFVLPSYQMAASRFEGADNRLTTLLTLASTLTLAAPIFAKSVNPVISFGSPWFVAGMVLFLLIVLIGLRGRVGGFLTVPDPMVHYCESLHLSPWEFKRDAIYFAGKHFDANVEAVAAKGRKSIWLMWLIPAEIVTFVFWIVAGL